MHCPKCGMENPDDARVCRSCGTPLGRGSGDIEPKTSGLAIAALALAVLSFVFFPVGIIAIVLGIAGLIVIEKSGGRLTGRVFAVLGIVIPVFVFCLIFVLFMLLFPALTRVQKQARTTVCLANLKQWGLVFKLYTDDHDGSFFGREADATGCWWMDPMRPYFRNNQQLLFCPETTRPHAESDDSSFVAWSIGDDSGSYGLNTWVCNPAQQEEASKPEANLENYWGTPSIRGVGNIPIFLDAAWFEGQPSHNDKPPDHPATLRPSHMFVGRGMNCFCIDRHTGHSNVLFMDWSVRRVGLKELWTLKWHREFDTQGLWTRAGGVIPSDWPPWMRNYRDY